MTVTRENILNSPAARDSFLDGIVLLDRDRRDITAVDLFNFLNANLPYLPMRGINQRLSVYDLFVFWHVFAMNILLPPGNAAHSAPTFLPWHRMFLIRLEEQLQRVLRDDNFALPYWDWAADGELGSVAQRQTQLWSAASLGEARGLVASGPLSAMRVRLWQGQGVLWSINPRPIQRDAGRDVRTLPRKSHVTSALGEPVYDQPPWSRSAAGHRNRLEGWINGPQLHNRVHVWIGGDMGPGSSPNDPAFFLNHCNVDRIWEAWMATNGRVYEPGAGIGPAGHRVDELMVAVLGEALRPQDVLDPTPWYRYDSLQVA